MKRVCLFLCAYVTFFSFGQNDKSLRGIDREITNLMEQYKTVGLSVAVVKDNKTIYSKGFGYRDLEKKLPVTKNTLFHIASMTKAFTGALLGILEAEDQLSLKDKPGLHIPNFRFYNEKMDNLITLEDLLSHKSGLGTHGTSIVLFPEMDKLKTVQRLKYLKPQAEIKNSWAYSNVGYTLAGTVVEQILDKSWDDAVQEMIFAPLGMHTSCTTVGEMVRSGDYALGYAMNKGNIEEVPFENYYSYSPAGAIKSSARDLSRWMHTWLNQGTFNDVQVIPENYIYEASRPQNLKYHEEYTEDSFLFTEGFGWRIRSWNGHYRLRHGGNTNGFSSVTELFPFDHLGIVVLCNQSTSILPYIVSDLISRRLLQLPPEKEYPIVVSDRYTPKEEEETWNTTKMPTQPLPHFIGTYEAKGYGKIEVLEEGGLLLAKLPTYTFTLQHLNYNSFYLKGREDFRESFDPEFTVQFAVDTQGEVASLQLFSQKTPVKFYKQKSKAQENRD